MHAPRTVSPSLAVALSWASIAALPTLASAGPGLSLSNSMTVSRGQAATISPGDACEPPAPAPSPPPASTWIAGGGCFADRFFVEVATGDPDLPAGFEAALDARLDAHKADLLDWICPDGDLVCRDISQPTPAAVTPVLMASRAWSVELSAPVRADKLCAAVSGVRAMAAEAMKTVGLSRQHPLPFVGRQCAMRMMDAEVAASQDMREWHLDAIFDGMPPRPESDPVKLALLDTGVRQAVALDLGVEQLWTRLDHIEHDPGATRHPHASWMALLIDQLSANSVIYDARVLNEDGIGAIADLAAALEYLLLEPDLQSGPLVVNLSLGWAPELSRTRVVDGPGCTSWEDPAGESVRFALGKLRDRDATHATVVLAAAGNRPERAERIAELYDGYFAVATDVAGQILPPHSACAAAPAAPAPDWFYPAEWNRRPTCEIDALGVMGPPRYLSWAVGATDDRDAPTVLSIDGPEPPVVAPGQHVYVDHPFAGDPIPAPMCAQTPSPNLLHLPGAVTGTSAATALVSAAAAEAQSARLRFGRAPLSGAALQHLVHLTALELGRDAWRPDPGGLDPVEARRLSFCGLYTAVEQDGVSGDLACQDLLACVTQPRSAVVDGGLVADCADAARDCFNATGCRGAVPERVTWDAAYTPPTPCLDDALCNAAWLSADPCQMPGAGGCPHEQYVDQHSAAPIGTMPGIPGCPDCGFLDDPGLVEGQLVGEISEQLKAGTVLRYPVVVVEYDDAFNSPHTEYIVLPQSQTWGPGDIVVVKDLPPLSNGARTALKGAALTLYTLAERPGEPSTTNASPLRILDP